MKNKLLSILTACAMLLTGCDEETGEPEISVTDITPKNGYHYALAEDCGDGCIYKSGTAMWYYDYKYRKSVPFCADPACKHDDKTCAAFLPGRVFGYKDKFVIAGNEMNWEAENCVDDDIFVLEEMRPDEMTKREVMRIDNRRWCDTYAYGDKLYIGLLEEYHLEGDNVHAGSDRNRVWIMVVSLDTLDVEYMSDCLIDALNVDIHFRGESGEKMFFNITYQTEHTEGWVQVEPGIPEEDDDDVPEMFTKHMVYDIGASEVSEYAGQTAWSYLNGCTLYFDGTTVTFDRGDKVCRLTSDYELPYGPFAPLLYENGKVYAHMPVETRGDYVLLIYDTETEQMTSVFSPRIGGLRFVTERENEFVLSTAGSMSRENGGGNDITVLRKDGCEISEVSPERYNELCKLQYDKYRE